MTARFTIDQKEQRIKRGHERRFGQSMLPLEITRFDEVYADTRRKVFDPETGSYTIWDISGKKMRCLAEGASQ